MKAWARLKRFPIQIRSHRSRSRNIYQKNQSRNFPSQTQTRKRVHRACGRFRFPNRTNPVRTSLIQGWSHCRPSLMTIRDPRSDPRPSDELRGNNIAPAVIALARRNRPFGGFAVRLASHADGNGWKPWTVSLFAIR